MTGVKIAYVAENRFNNIYCDYRSWRRDSDDLSHVSLLSKFLMYIAGMFLRTADVSELRKAYGAITM